ncbi:hypothetical protein D3C71_1924470 [compost metagenome]
MKSGPCGSMPMPQMANPAKPAPSSATIFRPETGTDLVFAEPWISTNCASTYLMPCWSRVRWVSAGNMG